MFFFFKSSLPVKYIIPAFASIVKAGTDEKEIIMVAIVAEMTPGAQKESYISELVAVTRPSFKKITGDGCRATLLNHFLYWIGRKALASPVQQNGTVDLERVLVWNTYEEITEALGNWGICKVRKEIRALCQSGLFSQVDSGTTDRTKRYQFTRKNAETLKTLCQQKGVCLLHLDLPPEIRHLMKVSDAIDESIRCNCLNDQMHLIKSGGCITKISTKISNLDLQQRETENDVAASQRNDTPSFPEIKQTELSTPETHLVDNSQHLIADSPTPEQSSLFPIASQSPNNKETEGAKQANAPEKVKLALPTNMQVWNAEALVQTLEFHRGRAYPNGAKRKSDRVRDTELEAAKTLITDAADIWAGHTTEQNAATLIRIVQNLETKWWLDTNGNIFPHQLVDKDRIHTAYNRINASAPTTTTAPIDLSAQREAARIKNLANLEKMDRIKAKQELEKQQLAGKKRAAI